MNTISDLQRIELLAPYLTQQRRDKIEHILCQRTAYVTILLEQLFQTHNASAISRSAEIFGVQDIQVVEAGHTFDPHGGVSMGSHKWLSFFHYPTIGQAADLLKQRGYRIVATTPSPDAIPLAEFPLDKPMVFLFGTEEHGLSEQAFSLADSLLTIPMVGFTQSFNVSVSVSLILYEITKRLHSSSIAWQLPDQRKEELRLDWYRKSIRQSDLLEKRLVEEYCASIR